ncbi:FkbM family methyltransferase [Candidatus Pacearchaeota archaeon]|jgi:FkbM family methyltransferase|nr:FkbM family methyltransferase [Candidatus Pacearchaeota archaeon]
MLKPIRALVYEFDLKIRGVIHIGGHYGQEYSSYKNFGLTNIVFVEPQPKVFGILSQNVGVECLLFNTALGNFEGKTEMFTEEANQGQSSSLLQPKKHLNQYPNIIFNSKVEVDVTKLDLLPLDFQLYNFINIDVQGYELEVFKGGVETLKNIDYVYAEVNRAELYKGCAMVEDIDNFLGEYKFKRVDTWWDGVTWGDALYIKG